MTEPKPSDLLARISDRVKYLRQRWQTNTAGLLEEAEREIEQLTAITDTLPRTADGVTITLGMDVWHRYGSDTPYQATVRLIEDTGFITTTAHGCTGDEVFSSREAVQAARTRS